MDPVSEALDQLIGSALTVYHKVQQNVTEGGKTCRNLLQLSIKALRLEVRS